MNNRRKHGDSVKCKNLHEFKMLKRMSTFLFTLLGLTVGAPDPCSMRREIAPCTCRLEEPRMRRVVVTCDQMSSFADIIEILRDRFPPEQDISLKINYSHLNDMTGRSFKELGMRVSNLKLNFDDLSQLPESSFTGLGEVEYLSLADNRLLEIPREVLRKMPKLRTLDMGRSRISNLWKEDFRDLPNLRHLLLPGNFLSSIESSAFPKTMRQMHIGINSLKDLNGSLRALTELEWLFINENQLTSLQQQLPTEAPKLIMIHAAHNHISKLPVELRNYPSIDSLVLSFNDISSLDGILQKCRRLKMLDLSHNKINTLADDDFAETELMGEINMGYNYLKHLNKAFSSMKKLRYLNLTHNFLAEFSFEEIRGLKNLALLDLSHNKIAHLNGRMENVVEVETRIEILKLEHNEIKALDGSLLGIHGLQKLNLSHNKLMNIAPNDLIGLEDLRILDISHNHLKTLEETSKTYLPRLQELIANDNFLRNLEKDFHGLPALCKADLSNNQIISIGTDLISKTRCKIEGVPGVLRIYLYDNPVICNPEFNVTADYMEGNFTILQADLSICSAIVQTTETAPMNFSVAANENISTTMSTVTSPQESEENSEPLIIAPQLIINQQTVPFPLLISPQDDDDDDEEEKKKNNKILINENKLHFNILKAGFGEKDENKTASADDGDDDGGGGGGGGGGGNGKSDAVEGNILGSVMIHSPVVVKDEGSNVTLLIPVENGAIKKDHIIDHYIQKNEDVGVINNKTKVSSMITNIDIVEIKQLPNEPSSATRSNDKDKEKDETN